MAGREVLERTTLPGWLEGYLLHGPARALFSCYEAFIHINRFESSEREALKTTKTIQWRRPIASRNYLPLSSHVWRQAITTAFAQDPGFSWIMCDKEAGVIASICPPDENCHVVGFGQLPAQSPLRERDRRRQTARAGVDRKESAV